MVPLCLLASRHLCSTPSGPFLLYDYTKSKWCSLMGHTTASAHRPTRLGFGHHALPWPLQHFGPHLPHTLSPCIPFTSFSPLHTTASLSGGSDHCQHSAGPRVVMTYVKGAVTFQPSMTHEGKNLVACYPRVLLKSLSFCLFQEAAPAPLPTSAPPWLRDPSSVSQNPLSPSINALTTLWELLLLICFPFGWGLKREGISIL